MYVAPRSRALSIWTDAQAFNEFRRKPFVSVTHSDVRLAMSPFEKQGVPRLDMAQGGGFFGNVLKKGL